MLKNSSRGFGHVAILIIIAVAVIAGFAYYSINKQGIDSSTQPAAVATYTWQNTAITLPAEPATVEFDAKASRLKADVIVGLSNGSADSPTDLGPIFRFNNLGNLDARNGAVYAADKVVSYATTTYHVRLVIRLSTHTYDVYITPKGGTETKLATNYKFRSEQATVTKLTNWAKYNLKGDATVTNFKASGGTTSAYTLTASPASVLPTTGDMTATWNVSGTPTNTDWIGLYKVGADARSFAYSGAWKYTGGATTGSIILKAPATTGPYEFRYFKNDSFDLLAATSNTVTVSSDTTPPPPPPPPTGGYTVSSNVTSVNSGGTITASWNAQGTITAKDWIGLYQTTAGNSSFIVWKYTNGLASGSLSLTVPTSATAGNYELRYLTNDSYTSTAKSPTITVTNDTPPPPPPPPTSGAKPGLHNTGPACDDPSICTRTSNVKLVKHSGVYTISQDGAVVENIDVDGQINIKANNVTLRNFRVVASGTNFVALRNDGPAGNGTTGVLVEDGEIMSKPGSAWLDGVGIGGTWDGKANVYRRLHIHHIHDGAKMCDNSTLEASYIHDLGYGGGGHSDGIQAPGHCWPVTVRGNFIDGSNVTSAINNVGTNWTIDGNWLAALYYTMYFNPESTNPKIINNIFLGPGSPQRFGDNKPQMTWTGNVDAAGKTISKP